MSQPVSLGGPMPRNLGLALGVLTGVVSLLGMIRLVGGAGLGSAFGWLFVLLAMLPWIGYCGFRARHGQLTRLAALAIAVLCASGLVAVWLFTLGPVLALACSLAAFVVIWIHDWPPRQDRGEDQFVRIEDLATDESRR